MIIVPTRAAAQDDMFGSSSEAEPAAPAGPRPLADRLRPRSLDEVVGQDHLLGPDGTLTRMLARGSLASLILWGPPGCGKTTIARLLAAQSGLHFVQLSAVFSGVADLKRAFEEAARRRRTGQGTLLFVDEIHRFNRAQQDGFLPVVETGTITLIGATTENPSFALNGALLSRCQVLVLRRLDDAALEQLLARAEAEIGRALPLDAEARATLRAMADGDGRYVLNMAEQIFALPADTPVMDSAALAALLARRAALYDKDREEHYNLISALHKSLRGSDPDAALYWFARMLNGGEDPRYIARRLVRFAAEDIGMADPNALPQALAGWETYERLGSPGGRTGDRAGGGLSRHRAEIERGLHRVQRGARIGQSDRIADAAGAHPQRADPADEGPRLRRRLRVRPRSRGCVLRPELLSGRHGARAVLPPARPRLRTRDQQAPRVLGQYARRPKGRYGWQLGILHQNQRRFRRPACDEARTACCRQDRAGKPDTLDRHRPGERRVGPRSTSRRL